MPMFNMRCNQCGHEWEASKAYEAKVSCPECDSLDTVTLLTGFNYTRVKSPMDLVHKSMSLPSAKKIRSFGNDRRRGGKDTS